MTTESFTSTLPRRGWCLSSIPLDELVHDPGEIVLEPPVGKVGSDLGQVGYVADVVAGSMAFVVLILQLVPHVGEQVDGLEDGEAVRSASAQVVDLATAGVPEK